MTGLLIWNIAVMLLYGIDKERAKQDKWRISEKMLIGCAFLLGALGAAAGMSVFRHKTRKTRFKVLIFIALICNFVIFYFIGIDTEDFKTLLN